MVICILRLIQEIVRASINPEFPYTAEDLALPLQIYQLRKQYGSDIEMNNKLDQAFVLIVSGDLEAAKALIAK